MSENPNQSQKPEPEPATAGQQAGSAGRAAAGRSAPRPAAARRPARSSGSEAASRTADANARSDTMNQQKPRHPAGLLVMHRLRQRQPRNGLRVRPLAYACASWHTAALPLFHLYGDPPDDSAFDFIHIETIASRSAVHDWTIRAHRHRNLFQLLLIEKGGGEMSFETSIVPFSAPAAILVPATIAHGFRFTPRVTDGWVVSFTEDCGRCHRRNFRRSAGAAQGGGGSSAAAARQRRRGQAPVGAVRGAQRRGLARARRLPHRHARAARVDRDRGGADWRRAAPAAAR